MRRRHPTRGTSSTRRAAVSVNANPGATPHSLALVCNREFSEREKDECRAGQGRVQGPTGSQERAPSSQGRAALCSEGN